MTEAEMKKTWCPYARVIMAEGEGSYNRVFPKRSPMKLSEGAMCIGRACSQWRWEYDNLLSRYTKNGYCGPAGRP